MTRLEDAYRACEEITRASATSFYYGMRLLPEPKRQAMYAIYALARRIDDIADGGLPEAEQRRALEAVRGDVQGLGPGGDDPVLLALADAHSRYRLPLGAFAELADGAEMDVDGTTYRTFDELVLYCRRVGGTIGRLSLAVFDPAGRDAAEPLADDLGVAFQLTNILRDVREDLQEGRVYLPAEDLERFGCTLGDGTGRFADLVRFEAARAEGWYDRGLGLLPHLDRQSAACVRTMAGIYRRLLRRLAHEPDRILAERVSLPTWEKGWVAARSLVGAAR